MIDKANRFTTSWYISITTMGLGIICSVGFFIHSVAMGGKEQLIIAPMVTLIPLYLTSLISAFVARKNGCTHTTGPIIAGSIGIGYSILYLLYVGLWVVWALAWNISQPNDKLKSETEPNGFINYVETIEQPQFKLGSNLSAPDYDKSILNEIKKADYQKTGKQENSLSTILVYGYSYDDFSRTFYLKADYMHVTFYGTEGDLWSSTSYKNNYLINEEQGKAIYNAALKSQTLQQEAYEKEKSRAINEYDISTFIADAEKGPTVNYTTTKDGQGYDIKSDGTNRVLHALKNIEFTYVETTGSPSITTNGWCLQYNDSEQYKILSGDFYSYLRLNVHYELVEISIVTKDEVGIVHYYCSKLYSVSKEDGKHLFEIALNN